METMMSVDPARTPKRSKFDEFMSRDGILRITEFHDIPPPQVRFGSAEVQVIRSADTKSRTGFMCLKIEYTDSDDILHTDTVDQDEMAALQSGLAHLIANRDQWRKAAQTYTEVNFSTRAGFTFGMYFNPSDGQVGEFLRVGGTSMFVPSLAEFKRCIDSAAAKMKDLEAMTLGA